jgi:hypothetical protein
MGLPEYVFSFVRNEEELLVCRDDGQLLPPPMMEMIAIVMVWMNG